VLEMAAQDSAVLEKFSTRDRGEIINIVVHRKMGIAATKKLS